VLEIWGWETEDQSSLLEVKAVMSNCVTLCEQLRVAWWK